MQLPRSFYWFLNWQNPSSLDAQPTSPLSADLTFYHWYSVAILARRKHIRFLNLDSTGLGQKSRCASQRPWREEKPRSHGTTDPGFMFLTLLSPMYFLSICHAAFCLFYLFVSFSYLLRSTFPASLILQESDLETCTRSCSRIPTHSWLICERILFLCLLTLYRASYPRSNPFLCFLCFLLMFSYISSHVGLLCLS